MKHGVIDVRECIAEAERLSAGREESQHKLQRAFIQLAGDRTIGLLAFGIWRGRSGILSALRSPQRVG